MRNLFASLLTFGSLALHAQNVDAEGWIIVEGDATYENEYLYTGDADALSSQLQDYLAALSFVKDLRNEDGIIHGRLDGWFVDCIECEKFWMDRNRFLVSSAWIASFRITPEAGKYKVQVTNIAFFRNRSSGSVQYYKSGNQSFSWSDQVLTRNHKNFSKDHLEDTEFLAGELRGLFKIR